jgi:FeS assembly SUF system protein
MTPQNVTFYPPHHETPSVVPDDAPVEDRILAALRAIYDPEIPVNIYDLGLIYGLTITPQGRVDIQMTLTSPACPVAGSLPRQVEQAVRNVAGVSGAAVELVWEPPWTQERMSEAAQLELGIL